MLSHLLSLITPTDGHIIVQYEHTPDITWDDVQRTRPGIKGGQLDERTAVNRVEESLPVTFTIVHIMGVLLVC